MLKNIFSKKRDTHISDNIDEFVFNYLKEFMPKNQRKLDIKYDTKLADLGIDSIKYMTLLIKLEEFVEKDLEEIVKEIDISTIQTVGDVIGLVKKFR